MCVGEMGIKVQRKSLFHLTVSRLVCRSPAGLQLRRTTNDIIVSLQFPFPFLIFSDIKNPHSVYISSFSHCLLLSFNSSHFNSSAMLIRVCFYMFSPNGKEKERNSCILHSPLLFFVCRRDLMHRTLKPIINCLKIPLPIILAAVSDKLLKQLKRIHILCHIPPTHLCSSLDSHSLRSFNLYFSLVSSNV